jgi:type I restriction enzyme R subunit
MNKPESQPTNRAHLSLGDQAATPDSEIDTSDIPEDTDWSAAERGKFVIQGEAKLPSTGSNSPTDTSEKGLESLIFNSLVMDGWLPGESNDYDQGACLDLAHLAAFLASTQPDTGSALSLDQDTPTRRQFLARLKSQIDSRGIIDVLRKGIQHQQHSITFLYGSPSPGNTQAAEFHRLNRFSVTRQLRYSSDNKQLALDLAIFINGLPIATMELKNSLTKQTAADAVEQYRNTRNPREHLFRHGRCAVHFAVDDQEVRFCTKLAGKQSEFLPFNKGVNNGAGNPVNPDGLKTSYLWQETLNPVSLTDIIENYTQKVGDTQIWPRYHQLDLVRLILADVKTAGAGQKYLVQHSAGSGKSNSIAWLARQLIESRTQGQPTFGSIIVITDRRVLDTQINTTIQEFTQVASTLGHAETSGDLRRLIEEGKKIIISTVQKFPFILDGIGSLQATSTFAIIIDEAHSSQGGRTTRAMNRALGDSSAQDEDEDTFEDQINQVMESRKMLTNASYFAFTATPKNKTLELFGMADPQPDGTVKHLAFHNYTMKQATQEGFIMDVLSTYTPIRSYFNVVKNIEDDPEFDAKRAQRKLRRYVENHDYAISTKAEIIVEHFHDSVFMPQKMGGQARAMLVTDGVDLAINYYNTIKEMLNQRQSPYKALVAFSGNREIDGASVSEAQLNGFSERRTAAEFKKDPYRILICADKFQTGYDEPLLNTMYVDKTLGNIKAVQTLSRLNRQAPNKDRVFVLDFMNNPDAIQAAFEDYYQTTILADETDPNKLHDLKGTLDQRQVYSWERVDAFVEAYLNGANRGQLDPALDLCVEEYLKLDEDGQVEFKSSAKAFTRLYAFLSQVLPYGNAHWEKLSIFLNFLIDKLPAPVEPDLSRGVLEAVDMDSYRMERKAAQSISLAEEDAEIDPVLPGAGGGAHETEMDRLSNIIAEFNKTWGGKFSDSKRVEEVLSRMPGQVLEDQQYQNARKNSGRQNAQVELDSALRRLITSMVRCHTELYKAYTEDGEFQD